MTIQATQPTPDQQANPYVPTGPEPLVFDQFQGINTSTTRPGVKPEEMAWCDGWFPLDQRNLRTLWDVSAAAATFAAGIAFYDFANIGSAPLAIVLLNDGSIVQVNTDTDAQTVIAAAGTIQNPSRQTCGIAQWGNQYVQIVSKQTDGYFIWDGTTFYKPGDSWPPGGTIPTGVSGTTIENYTGRVWIANGPTVMFSVAGSLVDFATGDGGGTFSSSDSFLRVGFTQLKQSNGFLYLIADSSQNYISGVQTSGSPPTTTFTNQNADPEVGTPWAGTVLVFGRNIIFANAFGVHVSYGAAVTKISEKLDGVYNTVPNFGGLIPSSAKATVFGRKVYILLLPIIDPYSRRQVNKLLIWNSKFWFASEQSVALTYIQSQEINSVLTAWGTDGHSLYRLFDQPSDLFTKVVQSRLWDTPVGVQELKAANRLWGMAQYYSLVSPTITIGIDNENSSSDTEIEAGPTAAVWHTLNGGVVMWRTVNNDIVEWSASGSAIFVFPPTAIAQAGVLTGLTARTDGADLALIMLSVQDEAVGYRG